MRLGVPMLDGRVAPRCTGANGLLVVEVAAGGAASGRKVELSIATPEELLELAHLYRFATLVCDGITRESRTVLLTHGMRVIENVVGSASEVVQAVTAGALRSGFGLLSRPGQSPPEEG